MAASPVVFSGNRVNSFQAVMVGVRDPKRIIAPCRFTTRHEAEQFGRLSAEVLAHYIFLEDWTVEELPEAANCAFHDGKVLWLARQLQ